MSRSTSCEGLREDLRFLNVHGGLRDGRLDRICSVPRVAVRPSSLLQDLSILRDPLTLSKRPQAKCVLPIIIDVDAEERRSPAVNLTRLQQLPQMVDRRSKTARKSQTAEFSSNKTQRDHAKYPPTCSSPPLIKIPRISPSPPLRIDPRYQGFDRR